MDLLPNNKYADIQMTTQDSSRAGATEYLIMFKNGYTGRKLS